MGKSLCEILIEEEESASTNQAVTDKKETENKQCGMKSENPVSFLSEEKAASEDSETFEELDDTKSKKDFNQIIFKIVF